MTITLTPHVHTAACIGGLAVAGLAAYLVFGRKLVAIGTVMAWVGLVWSAWMFTAGQSTLRVRERDGVIGAERYVEVHPPALVWRRGTRLVNDTAQPLVLVTISYTRPARPSLTKDFHSEKLVPSGADLIVHHTIHWVGQKPPPPLIPLKSSDDGIRYWLTW